MNFMNMLGQLMRYAPGYLEGQRLANQDNWNDLNQYNQVQAGQLANAFAEHTFDDRVNMSRNQRGMSDFDLASRGMGFDLQAAMFPGQWTQATLGSAYAPYLQRNLLNGQLAQSIYASNMWGDIAQGKQPQWPALGSGLWGGAGVDPSILSSLSRALWGGI